MVKQSGRSREVHFYHRWGYERPGKRDHGRFGRTDPEKPGYRVTAVKIDPYLNIDAGTMNPAQHGEVFVLKDGSEVDLDLGNYERFLDIELTASHNITTGKVIARSSIRSAGATSSARPSRSSPISPTRSRPASSRRPKKSFPMARKQTYAWSK